MIYIYDKKTPYRVALNNNGVYSLDNLTISAETTEDISGNYDLNLEIELVGNVPTGLYELIQIDNIIKVNDEYSEELFRIAQVNKGLDVIEIYARHITISDSLNLWLGNVRPTNLNGTAALQWLAKGTVPQCNLMLSSNISNVNTADYVRKNLHEALVDSDNSFINKWGGEVKRTGYEIIINNKLGQDKTNLIKIKEALNLTQFNAKTNVDEVTTVIYPIGFDGIAADRVVSDKVGLYSMEFPALVKYEDVKVKKKGEGGDVQQEGYETEEEARAELVRRARLEFTEKHIDQIQFTCDIDYVDLNKYDEYKELSQLQTANLGDYISVRVDTFDMDLKARIISRVYDVLRGERIENTLSTDGMQRKPESIKDIIKQEIGDGVISEAFQNLGPYIDDKIQQGFKSGYIVYDKDAVYAVEKLPKEQAKNVVVLNKNGLGYSSAGISGPFTYGFTIDGKLNASMITTGTLNGQYIGAGTIEANKLTVAAKQEITKGMATSEKVTQLEANIDGVNAKVSEVSQKADSNTSKITTLEATTNGIKTSVSNVENKAGANAANITKLEQNSKEFQFKIENSGVANLIRTANGINNNMTKAWELRQTGNNTPPQMYILDNSDTWAYPDPNVKTFGLKTANSDALQTGEIGIVQYNIAVEKGKEYIFSCWVAAHRIVNTSYCYIRGHKNNPMELIASKPLNPPQGGRNPSMWERVEVKFTSQLDYVHIELGFRGPTQGDPFLWFAKPMLNKGSVASDFTNSQKEITTGITKIDANGVRCDFENGTYAEMGRDGFKYKRHDWEHPYQYITKVIKIAHQRNGHWATVNLGPEFVGKEINVDFKINHHIGAVDCNAFVETGQYGGALRASFTEIANWNKNNATLQARCCIQKITLKTEVMFGWDAQSTDTNRGGIIGESAGDIVIIAQM